MYFKRLLLTTIVTKVDHLPSIKIFFFSLNQRSISASAVIDFIAKKLQQRHFRISRLIYDAIRILRRLIKIQKLGGYKLLMAGRFSRRDRATYI